jgi:hypothetical protein
MIVGRSLPLIYRTQLYCYSFALHPDKFHYVPLGGAASEVPMQHFAEARSVIKATFS